MIVTVRLLPGATLPPDQAEDGGVQIYYTDAEGNLCGSRTWLQVPGDPVYKLDTSAATRDYLTAHPELYEIL